MTIAISDRIGCDYVQQLRQQLPHAIVDEQWQTADQATLTVKPTDLVALTSLIFHKQGGWLSVSFANDERSLNGHFAVYHVFSMEGDTKCWITVKVLVDADTQEYPSITPTIPAAVWGEREIRDAAEMLRKAQLRHTEILPLYARLSPAEQQKIFQSHPGRRVVLATNVAETSLTVPGIRYVIDSGTARISRYSYRAKVQRLPIEAISQASANQRKGRCGRVEPGICIRLYSEEDFIGRPEFTDPEILRTNLAAVILQMLHLRLGSIEDFPFIEPPDGKAISDGFNLLQELSAVDRNSQLTPLGRQLARLPVDPRMGRMLLEAAKLGSLQEVLIVASAMSIRASL